MTSRVLSAIAIMIILVAIRSVDVTPTSVSWSRDALPDVAQLDTSAHCVGVTKQILPVSFISVKCVKYSIYSRSKLFLSSTEDHFSVSGLGLFFLLLWSTQPRKKIHSLSRELRRPDHGSDYIQYAITFYYLVFQD